MKLLCDQMLGTLAKWLRIFGYDTFFANNIISDNDLINVAKNEDRVLITRDKELIQKSKKQKIRVIGIDTIDLDGQIRIVLENFEIDEKLFLSRCTICNSEVEKIDKKLVKGKVPKKVFEKQNRFFYCQNCDKYYWFGSHYDKMVNKIKGI